MIAGLFIALYGLGQLADTADFPAELQLKALKATVKITAVGTSGTLSGTGTIVARDGADLIVLTANHVVPNADSYEVQFWPHDVRAPMAHSLSVVSSSGPFDVCVIRVPAPRQLPAIVPICRDTNVPSGRFPVFTIGCSNGASPTVHFASAVAIQEIEHSWGKGTFWVLDREAIPGRSGGAMIAKDGTVIGVCYGSGPGRGYYAHTRQIHKLCDAANMTCLYASPQVARSVRLGATLELVSQPRWTNPSKWQATADLILRLNVQADTNHVFDTPLQFNLDSDPNVKFHASKRIAIVAPGPSDVPVSLTVPLQTERVVTLTIHPTNCPTWVKDVQPARVQATIRLTPPPNVVTTITAKTIRVNEAKWHNLKDGSASFAADVRVIVDGPIGDGSALAIKTPANVLSLTPARPTIHTGEQTVRLNVVGVLRPAPKHNEFWFGIDAPRQGPVEVRIAAPMRVTVSGPPPMQLRLAQGDHINPLLTARGGTGSQAMLQVRPVVVGSGAQAVGLDARLISKTLRLSSQAPLPLFRDTIVHLRPVASQPRPFFRDSLLESELRVEPATSCVAVQGTTHVVQLTREAPFKRNLAIILAVVFVCCVIYLPYRFVTRCDEGPRQVNQKNMLS